MYNWLDYLQNYNPNKKSCLLLVVEQGLLHLFAFISHSPTMIMYALKSRVKI